jgi:hypothetical protein
VRQILTAGIRSQRRYQRPVQAIEAWFLEAPLNRIEELGPSIRLAIQVRKRVSNSRSMDFFGVPLRR